MISLAKMMINTFIILSIFLAPAGAKEGDIIAFKLAETSPRDGLIPAETPEKITIYLHAETKLSEKDIARASAIVDEYGNYNIEITFNTQGRIKLAEITARHKGILLAVIIEGKVIIAPLIMQEISGGKAVISGKFTAEEARRIAESITPVKRD